MLGYQVTPFRPDALFHARRDVSSVHTKTRCFIFHRFHRFGRRRFRLLTGCENKSEARLGRDRENPDSVDGTPLARNGSVA
jgi:hypothetical protein